MEDGGFHGERGQTMPSKKNPAKAGKKSNKLTKKDLEKIREALLAYRDRLSGDLSSIEEEARQAGEQEFSVDHMADHGSDTFFHDFNLGLIENVGRTLAEIDRALARLDRGTYGTCLLCQEPIPKARLEYLPWARFCVPCQTKIEKGEVIWEEPPEEEEPEKDATLQEGD